MISIDDFAKVEMQIGEIMEASGIEGSDRLLKLQVDFNEGKLRQILSGIKKWYTPAQLTNKQFVFVTNLKPRYMMGFESHGMILACGDEKPIPLKPYKKVPNGTKVR